MLDEMIPTGSTWKAGNPALVIMYMCIKSSHCMPKYIQLHLSVILKAPGWSFTISQPPEIRDRWGPAEAFTTSPLLTGK